MAEIMVVPARERRWACLVHLSSFLWVSIPFGHILGPALIKRLGPKTDFVQESCDGAIRFNCWAALLLIVTYIATNIILGYLVVFILAVLVLLAVSFAATISLSGKCVNFRHLVPKWFTVKTFLICFGLIVVGLLAVVYGHRQVSKNGLSKHWSARVNKEFASFSGQIIKKEGLHNTLFPFSELSMYVYHDNKESKVGEYPGGFWWQSLGSYQNRLSGFYAEVFESPAGEVAIAFRGTEDFPDIITDISMAMGIVPQQFYDAEAVFNIVRNNVTGNQSIILTGHSLGGALAQYVAAHKHVRAITFNSFGAAHLVTKEALSASRLQSSPPMVLNVVQSTDIVSNTAFSYTLSGIVKNLAANLAGDALQHVGCMASLFHLIPPKEAVSIGDLIGWHSVSKLNNDMLVLEFSAPPSLIVDQCVDLIPAWHLPAQWICKESGREGLLTKLIKNKGGCPNY